MSFTTQSMSATMSARMVSVCGFGLSASSNRADAFAAPVNPPRPPPWVVPGK